MKIPLILASLAVFALVLAACGGDGGETTWTDPEDLLMKQVKWLNDGKWDKAFQTCSPSYRESHTVDDAMAEFEAAKVALGVSKFGIKDIIVNDKDDLAAAFYTVTGDGEDLVILDNPHVFHRFDGVWYDNEC